VEFGPFGDVDESILARKHFHAPNWVIKTTLPVNLARFDFLEHGGLSSPWRDRVLHAWKLLFGKKFSLKILTCQMTAEVHRAVEDTDDLKRLTLD
jgi:hypothetical protein